MKNTFFLFLLTLLLLPTLAIAECKNSGTTVIYINGILTDKDAAKKDKDFLKSYWELNNDINFINGFNQSHLAGLGDLIKSTIQAYGSASLDYDLTNILIQVHSELSTRKVLLVGHSQGTFYTNAAYDYLITHGVPAQSIAVYNIATPADRVAGGGDYLTSKNDKVIDSIVRQLIEKSSARKPLPANIDIPMGEGDQDLLTGGHSLSKTYLAGAPDKIVMDMEKALSSLADADNNPKECFIPPKVNISYRIKEFSFSLADGSISLVRNAANSVKNTSVAVADSVFNFAWEFVYSLAEALKNPGIFIAGLNSGQKSEVAQDLATAKDLLATVSPAVSPAVQRPEIPDTPDSEVLTNPNDTSVSLSASIQDQIDDILEKIDILKQKLAEQLAQEAGKKSEVGLLQPQPDKGADEKQKNNQPQISLAVSATNTTNTYTGGGGSVSAVIYPKILISEVQIGGLTDAQQEFVELYNPNSQQVDLTGWYVQRKTKTGSSYSTFAPNTLFSGKKISANGYFLIARQDSGFAGDIFIDNPLTEDNSLVLKNPNGEISDKVGFGIATDYELLATLNPAPGQSIGRKIVSGEPTDTNSNLLDFELSNPTPRLQNTVYVAPEPTPEPTPEPALETAPEPTPEPEPEPIVLKNILINEIQVDSIEGTGGTNDDWVELYNPNDVEADISQWSIQRTFDGSTIYRKNFEEGSKIKAGGYFLIVRNNANENLLGIADMTASALQLSVTSTVFLVKNQESIEGGDDLDIIDKVGFGENAIWPETAEAPTPPESKSIERIKLGLDTDDNSKDFKVSDSPTPKGTFPKVTIQDATDYLANISAVGNMYNLLIKWQSPSPNIDFYQVEYKLNNGNWVSWLADTAKTQENFIAAYSLLNDNIYFFRARAKDKDGNQGDWSEITEVDLTNPILINEVAFSGTNASAQDQWIELYNRSDKDINLNDWSIVSGTSGQNSLNISLKGSILAKGYFILERNDDNALSDVLADQIFTSATSENLYLRNNKGRYVDKVSKFASVNGYSQERVSPYSFGNFSLNWKINDGKMVNGKDRNGSDIYGTPAQQNSLYQLYTYYSSTFFENTTLTKALSPFLFDSLGTEIPKNVVLTVEPGVVVKFYNNKSRLIVNGTLKVIGSPSDKVIFTSFRDDEFGGDTNNNGSDLLPAPGDWLGIYFSKDSANSELENINVRYGGAVLGSSPFTWGNALWVDNSAVSIKNSVIEKNKNRGLMLENSNSIVDSVTFSDHQQTDWSSNNESKAIYIKGGSPKIENSYFENNVLGMYIDSFFDSGSNTNLPASPIISNNNFTKNKDPIWFKAFSSPVFSGNLATENNHNAIILSDDVSKDTTLSVDLPYLVKSVITVLENKTLNIEPGVIINFLDNWSGMQIDGTLSAKGTSDNPITFRPYNYDKDTVIEGNWLGLRFTKTSQNSHLENVSLMYGGAFLGNSQNQAFTSAIKVDQSSIILKDSVIQKNANNGVWLANSPSVIDGVQFLEHTKSTVSLPAKAVYVQGGSPIIKNSSFQNNNYGIYIKSWQNPDTGENIAGAPDYSEGNEFSGNNTDIYPIPIEPLPNFTP